LFAGRFQQVTSPVMAKGVEDTAFYRYFPLSSLNEVGDEPAGRPVSVEDFHRENAARRADWPGGLLATTTHDTKRSEDVRARIDVLSEVPQEWGRMVNRWTRLNRRHHREVDGAAAPSRGDEYLFYQSLLGIWPDEGDCPDFRGQHVLMVGENGTVPFAAAAHRDLVARLQAYMEKATREAKLRTSWLNPNAEYDAAVREFVAAALDLAAKNRFLAEFAAFHAEIARYGLFNALAQVLLKLTSPGVPDIYQGQELWDFSLVDPDNRRPVDFALRRKLLAELQREAGRGPAARRRLAQRLAANPADPRLKLFVVWQTLQFRRAQAGLFRRGHYLPLTISGAQANHVCAFAWQGDCPDFRIGENGTVPLAQTACQTALVIVPRLLARLARGLDPQVDRSTVPLGAAVWQDTRIELPAPGPRTFTNLFTGQPCRLDAAAIQLADVFAEFPVALLMDKI
jgi:(1->4)-alpha-D-glucan 1-alpha-D-glucosylmutase